MIYDFLGLVLGASVVLSEMHIVAYRPELVGHMLFWE